jgi:integrase
MPLSGGYMSIIRRGKNTFLVRVYVRRDPVTKKRIDINETVHGSLSYAKKREAKLKDQQYSGRFVKSSGMTVDALFKLYLDSARHTLGIASYDQYDVTYRRYAQPYIGGVAISKIKHSDFQQLFNFLLDPKKDANGERKDEKVSAGLGLSPRTVRGVRAVLKCAFGFALNNQLIAEDPISRTKVTFREKPRSTSLTIEEAKAFVSVRSQLWWGNALVFQLYTGLRNQELKALIWDDVDFDNGTLRIERASKTVRGVCAEIGPPKTKRSNRVIKLEPEHLTLLRSHYEAQQEVIKKHRGPEPYGDSMVKDWIRRERPRQAHLYTRTDLIFPKRDGRILSNPGMERAFHQMLRRAGIPDERNIRQYDLRHTHASLLFAAGIPSIDIAARLGNSVAVCEGTYGHALKERRSVPSRVFTDLVPLE